MTADEAPPPPSPRTIPVIIKNKARRMKKNKDYNRFAKFDYTKNLLLISGLKINSKVVDKKNGIIFLMTKNMLFHFGASMRGLVKIKVWERTNPWCNHQGQLKINNPKKVEINFF